MGDRDTPATPTPTSGTDARAKVLGWARRSIDLIPTPWLLGGLAAVALATTAGFGGLATAPAEPTPQIEIGEPFAAADLTMTVLGVSLVDDPGYAALYPDQEAGERILAIEAEVVNTYREPRPSVDGSVLSPVVDGIRITSLGGAAVETVEFDASDDEAAADYSSHRGVGTPPAISRADDGTGSPMLQPDVPTRVLIAWIVADGEVEPGEEITLTLPDSTRYTGTSVVDGDYWWDVEVGATVTTTVEETMP
ncbi:hypothetical protein [Microbacterium maritypicum]